MAAEQSGIEIGPHGVDVVQQKPPQLRTLSEEPRQHPVAKHVGNLIPVSHRVQALLGDIVGVVVAFARCFRPVDQRRMDAVANLLLLFVQNLVRQLFPGEAQIAGHGNHAQANGPPR